MIDLPVGNVVQRSVVRTMMRHIEPLLMTLGYLYAQVQALIDREETHDETPATIREKMLGYTPATLMSGFIPELTSYIARLNQMTRMQPLLRKRLSLHLH